MHRTPWRIFGKYAYWPTVHLQCAFRIESGPSYMSNPPFFIFHHEWWWGDKCRHFLVPNFAFTPNGSNAHIFQAVVGSVYVYHHFTPSWGVTRKRTRSTRDINLHCNLCFWLFYTHWNSHSTLWWTSTKCTISVSNVDYKNTHTPSNTVPVLLDWLEWSYSFRTQIGTPPGMWHRTT